MLRWGLSTISHLIGLYWIDPNGGCRSDAVAVHCNFSGGVAKTCLVPVQQRAARKSWNGESIWFSALSGGFQVVHNHACTYSYKVIGPFYCLQLSYDIPKNQVQSLQASSHHASQNFKYFCRNSAASVIFRTSNGKEITASQTIYDGCQVQSISATEFPHCIHIF